MVIEDDRALNEGIVFALLCIVMVLTDWKLLLFLIIVDL